MSRGFCFSQSRNQRSPFRNSPAASARILNRGSRSAESWPVVLIVLSSRLWRNTGRKSARASAGLPSCGWGDEYQAASRPTTRSPHSFPFCGSESLIRISQGRELGKRSLNAISMISAVRAASLAGTMRESWTGNTDIPLVWHC